MIENLIDRDCRSYAYYGRSLRRAHCLPLSHLPTFHCVAAVPAPIHLAPFNISSFGLNSRPRLVLLLHWFVFWKINRELEESVTSPLLPGWRICWFRKLVVRPKVLSRKPAVPKESNPKRHYRSHFSFRSWFKTLAHQMVFLLSRRTSAGGCFFVIEPEAPFIPTLIDLPFDNHIIHLETFPSQSQVYHVMEERDHGPILESK